MQPRDGSKPPDRRQLDWRGWIALLWALWWGWAYAVMAIHARSPQVLTWLRSLAK
jgi:hypothetical protein